MRYVYSILTTFAFLFLIFFTMMYNARAQIAGPFPESDEPNTFQERSITFKCVSTSNFVNMARAKNLRLIAFDASPQPVIKMIFMNKEGEAAIINSLPDNSVCILDLYSNNTQYSQEFKFLTPDQSIKE